MTVQQRMQFALAALLGVGIIVLIMFAWATSDTAAQGPPLPTPTNVSSGDGGSGDDDDDDGDRTPVGAYIELQAQPVQAGLWSVVQWQDKDGNWHDVEGWRSALEANGYQRWWVAAKDFNTGPFRWVVTQGPRGALLGNSRFFYLPNKANDTLRIMVSLESQSGN